MGEYYRRHSWLVQETGGGGADGGIDLVLKRNSETWLVQCKRFAQTAVNVKTVRELLGVVASERATDIIFIITITSTFTRDVNAFAKGQRLHIVDGETLLKRIQAVQREKALTTEVSTATAVPEPQTLSESLIVHCA